MRGRHHRRGALRRQAERAVPCRALPPPKRFPRLAGECCWAGCTWGGVPGQRYPAAALPAGGGRASPPPPPPSPAAPATGSSKSWPGECGRGGEGPFSRERRGGGWGTAVESRRVCVRARDRRGRRVPEGLGLPAGRGRWASRRA